MLYTKSRT